MYVFILLIDHVIRIPQDDFPSNTSVITNEIFSPFLIRFCWFFFSTKLQSKRELGNAALGIGLPTPMPILRLFKTEKNIRKFSDASSQRVCPSDGPLVHPSVSPSVHRSVRNPLFSNTKKACFRLRRSMGGGEEEGRGMARGSR